VAGRTRASRCTDTHSAGTQLGGDFVMRDYVADHMTVLLSKCAQLESSGRLSRPQDDSFNPVRGDRDAVPGATSDSPTPDRAPDNAPHGPASIERSREPLLRA
jgi:hypothetical protein